MSEQPSPSGVILDSSVRDVASDLGIDYRSLFIDLGKAAFGSIVGFGTGSPKAFRTAIGHVIDAFSAFDGDPDLYKEVGDDPGKLAWLLIHEALLSAAGDFIKDHRPRLQAAHQDADEALDEESVAEHLDASLGSALSDAKVQISASFFDRPAELEIIEPVQEDLIAWFDAVEVSKSEAESIVSGFPSYFRVALIEEWREHSEYKRLESAIDSPFTQAQRRAQAWEAYRAQLRKAINEPVFGKTVSLKQIYVWPRAFVQVPVDEESETGASMSTVASAPGIGAVGEGPGIERRVCWLRESVMDWLDGGDKSDDIRIIRGDPGTGKSSFSKMFAAQIAERDDYSVVFVPLHQLDATKGLKEAIQEFTSSPSHPLEGVDPFEEEPLLLVLDGLDELSERGSEGADLARDFVDEIDRSLGRINQRDISVRVLLSGRKIAADAAARVLRGPEKIFNLIPFVPEGKQDVYEDPKDIAFDERGPIDQRDKWWEKYGKASGSSYEGGMPSRFRQGRLDDITRQPLLSHLVALAYEDENASFSEDASPNALYDELLGGVYRRRYGSGPLPGTDVLSGMREEEQEESFIRVLEEIAMDVWGGDGRTTTVSSIEERCKEEGLLDHFDAFRDGLGAGISRLLTTFYFREGGQGQDTFEFTHKTFAEYLTARRIVRTVEEICDERQRNRRKGGNYGHDMEEALRVWIRTCGPSAIDEDLFEFFRDEVRIRHEEDGCAEDWKETFAELVRYVLREDMPMHMLDNDLSYEVEKVWARNAEEALLAVIHASRLALLTGVDENNQEAGLYAAPVLEDVPEETAANWIRRLQASFSDHWRSLHRRLLSSVKWESSDLSDLILYEADLQGANLREAELRGSSLLKADLRQASLIGANLLETDLRGADLKGADLLGANLQGADLRITKLLEVDPQRANFEGADFRGAHLEGVDLRTADLQGADFRDANLRGVNFRGADLPEKDFHEAKLQEADFRGADLSKGSFRDAELPRADLREADLYAANLRRAGLRNAKLQGANLRMANLQGEIPDEFGTQVRPLEDTLEVEEALETENQNVIAIESDIRTTVPERRMQRRSRRKRLLEELQMASQMGQILSGPIPTQTSAALEKHPRRTDLRGANLHETDLREANLQAVDFQRAYVQEGNLQEANLRGADFRNADLQGAILQSADLREANLQGANLREVDLRNTDLRGADLRRTQCQGASLTGVQTNDDTRLPDELQERIGA